MRLESRFSIDWSYKYASNEFGTWCTKKCTAAAAATNALRRAWNGDEGERVAGEDLYGEGILRSPL